SGTSGLMSGEGKRGDAPPAKQPRSSSTLPSRCEGQRRVSGSLEALCARCCSQGASDCARSTWAKAGGLVADVLDRGALVSEVTAQGGQRAKCESPDNGAAEA